MPKKAWTVEDIPPQSGKVVLITGATGGLGFETALVFAQTSATVILAGRNEDKGKYALSRIRSKCPDAVIEFGKVDLASLTSISEFAETISAKYPTIDILINNAGVMMVPKRETTKDGFEIQFGTNYLSHFALTAQLLPLLRRSPAPRVVNLSSLAHRRGKINFDDLQNEKRSYGYGSYAYAQSKLAVLMFSTELQRRSDDADWGITSVAAHPGIARTDLFNNGPGETGILAWLTKNIAIPCASQSAADGVLPILYAATSHDAYGGGYYGPDGFYEMKGAVAPSYIAGQARDQEVAYKLWEVSTKLTGVTWP